MLDGSVMEIERCKGSNYCLILYVLQYWFKVILCVLTLLTLFCLFKYGMFTRLIQFCTSLICTCISLVTSAYQPDI